MFNLLLQILDDGRLTDGQGRLIDFTNTVIIMTSNLGSSELADGGKDAVLQVIRGSFKPEFINRIDEIIVFNSLGREVVSKIVELQLNALKARLSAKEISLSWDDGVVRLISNNGYNPDYGARPIRRAVQTLVENPLAISLLHGQFREGDSIHLSLLGNQITVNKQ